MTRPRSLRRLATATADTLPEVLEVQLDPTERTVAVPRLRLGTHARTETFTDEPAVISPEPSDIEVDTTDPFSEASLARAMDSEPAVIRQPVALGEA